MPPRPPGAWSSPCTSRPSSRSELARRYRSIYLAGPTFNLIVDDDTAWRALARIRLHLEPDGSALIPLFIPRPLPAEALGVTRTHLTGDGRMMRCTVVSEDRDDTAGGCNRRAPLRAGGR